MKVLMFGRGAVATTYGWALERAGHHVEFFVRPGRAAEYGDTVDLDLIDLRRRPWGRRIAERWAVTYREALAPDHGFDLIVLSLPHHRLAEAASFLAPRIGEATVLMLSNVWAEPLAAIHPIPADQVAWGFPGAGGAFDADGVLRGLLAPTLSVGTLDHPPTPRDLQARHVFRTAGIRMRERPDIRGWLWMHFLLDAGLHSRAVRVGALADLIGATGELREALLTTRELLPVLRARGVDLRRHRAARMLLRAPVALTAPALSRLVRHVGPARLAFAAHSDPATEEPRAICRDVLAEARRLGVAAPRLEAAEQYFRGPSPTAPRG